ncbi:MAG: hypothetical protein DME62_01675 [Verrucomicrobia bacterium]|nr:MAG: hypothetical protein DME62_01675 [Verrucomicrobiota bacterium]
MVAGIEGRSQLGPCAFATALHRDHEKDRLGKVTDAGRVLVITGAGVSAESGIPTFRGKDGYWRNFDPAKLATPEAFARDPKLVWDARAGLPKEKMVQIHGDIFLSRCSRCDWRAELCDAEERGTRNNSGLAGARPSTGPNEHEIQQTDLPYCARCHALMRPGVVWFGEQLPWDEVRRVEDYLGRGACDLVIVAGTTATFGYIIDWALRANASGGELIEVNPDETPLSTFATQRIHEPAAIALPRLIDQICNP